MDPDARVRLEVVDVLDRAGDPAALPIVEPLAQDTRSAGGACRRARRRAASRGAQSPGRLIPR